jgi:hypothetical protein
VRSEGRADPGVVGDQNLGVHLFADTLDQRGRPLYICEEECKSARAQSLGGHHDARAQPVGAGD